ncbi:MAG: Rieske 2Fe-2S domain-containing protein [Urechidicola sp.]|nr:Rieske 2Fe-2S domain-containing protein [Urechidicola sp.]
MKKFLLLFSFIALLGCESNENFSRCDIINSATINLVNPEFINLQVPGGWAYASGGPRGLILYNAGSSFKAFSRECPHSNTCTSAMVVENDIKMVCPCDDAAFSILDGSPQTSGINDSVCEFKVTQVSGTVLSVTNF